MKRLIALIFTLLVMLLPLTSCGGGGTKVVKALQKVVKSDFTKKATKTIGRSGDDFGLNCKKVG